VIYLTSFSKMLAPALRLGALAAPPALLTALAGAKQGSDLVSSTVMQRALAGYLRAGHLPAHLAHVRSLYRQRRDTMLAALKRELPECPVRPPAGGLNLWLRLPSGLSERSIAGDAIDAGVGVAPGRYFFVRPPATGHLRLSFSLAEPGQIEEGIATLAGVIRHHQRVLSRARQVAAPLV
jgi:2-aminoadipate transaminase